MNEAVIQAFLSSFDDSRFPEDFLADYEALECLAYHEGGETLLVKSRKTGRYFVAKCYTDKALLSNTTESDLLKRLRHGGLPAFAGEYQNDAMLCVVREYVEGTPLDEYAVQNRLIQEQIISIGVQLCDILAYLHGQKPPVIHRDIKPQNIIMGAGGKIRLIDFGISRVYDEAAQEDTVCFGTKRFAAPEQYGFSQTDGRADIFSMGVLLGWLLTGEPDAREAASKIENERLRRIVQKCTAFAPEKRYASVEKVKTALLGADGRRQKSAICWACGMLAGIVFLCAGFAVGRYTDFAPAFSASFNVTFKEPLIEQAVRLMLDKQEGDPIAEPELLSVTGLYIYGGQTLDSYQAFGETGQHMMLNDGTVHNGGISTLSDLAMLKNLRTVHIALQNISDVSPLASLESLEQLELKHNPLADLSPLASLDSLQGLFLYDTRVSDLSALSGCPMLNNLDVGRTDISSMTALKGIGGLKYLHMREAPVKTLAGIEEFTELEKISLTSVADGDLSPLMGLPKLKEAYLGEALREAAEEDLKQARFDIIYP